MSLMLLILGTTLTAISWVFAWSNAGIMSEYSFFPLWIGYILTINGIGEAAYRTSLIRVMRWYFLALFIASIPLWWFFEVVNGVVHNWEYILPHPISGLHYVIQASTNFATVLPAVLSTAFVAHWVLTDGRYLLPVSVMSATLFTGLWWELWNFYSMPKWIYHIPYVGFWKIFEMPVLGYFGYPFFGIIVFSWAFIVLTTFFKQDLIRMFEARQ